MDTNRSSGLKDRTVGEVVAEDYARAAVFKRMGIDFCAKLEEFEEDLHRHVHLENNVLFPQAAALEGRT